MTDTFELTPETPLIRLGAAGTEPSASAEDDASTEPVAPSSSDGTPTTCVVCDGELGPGKRKFCGLPCKRRAYRASRKEAAPAKTPAASKVSRRTSAPAPAPVEPGSPSPTAETGSASIDDTPAPSAAPASGVAGLVGELLALPAAGSVELHLDGVRLVVLPISIKQGGGGPSPADRP